MWFKMTKTKQGPSEFSSGRTITPTRENFNWWAATGGKRQASESDSEDSRSDEGLWMMTKKQRDDRKFIEELKAWRKGRFDAWIDSVGQWVKTGDTNPIMYMTEDGGDTFPRTWYEETLAEYEGQIEAKEVKPEWDTMIPPNVNDEELPAWSDSEGVMSGLCMGCRFTVIIQKPSEELETLFAEDNCEGFPFHTDHMDLEEMIRNGELGMGGLGAKLNINGRNTGLEWNEDYEIYERWNGYSG